MVLSCKLSSIYRAQMYRKHKFFSSAVYRTTWRQNKNPIPKLLLDNSIRKLQSKQMKKNQNANFKVLELSYMVMGNFKYCQNSIHAYRIQYQRFILQVFSICYLHAVHPGIRNIETNCLLYSQIVNGGSPEFLMTIINYEMQLNCWATHNFRAPALSGLLNKKPHELHTKFIYDSLGTGIKLCYVY